MQTVVAQRRPLRLLDVFTVMITETCGCADCSERTL